jgi:hypothetical protein
MNFHIFTCQDSQGLLRAHSERVIVESLAIKVHGVVAASARIIAI